MPLRLLILGVALALAAPAWAHGGEHQAPAAWWAMWTWDPLVIANLLVVSGLYMRGLRRLWGALGPGRGVSRLQASAFGAGIAVIAAALLSPIDRLSDQLQAAHMIQHMLLMMVAAPLVILGNPFIALLWALPSGWRQGAGGLWQRKAWRVPYYLLWQPLLMWLLFAFTLWVWHLPTLYEAALHHPWIHQFQHLGFFVASCLFWRVVLDPLSKLRLMPILGVLYLFTTSLHATLLGVFMALAPRAWYPFYLDTTGAWQLTPLEDQQLAGLIMWMPACTIYAVVATAIFAWWLREPETSR